MGSAKIIAALLVACSLASSAAAQPSAEPPSEGSREDARTDQARELFHRGAALTRAGRWQEALAAFEQSKELRPHAGTLYNIAYCERALGHTTRARKGFLQALERNAVQASTELSPKLLADSKRYLAEADERLAKLTVRVAPADVGLAVDGRPLEVVAGQGQQLIAAAGTAAPGPGELVAAERFELWVDPGNHVFVLSRGEAGDTAVDHTFAPGYRGQLSLTWQPPAARPTPAAVDRSRDPGASQRAWAIGVGASGLAALAVGGILGGVAADTWSQAEEACPGGSRCPDRRGSELSADAHQLGNGATIALVTGGSALVGAAVLWLSAPAAAEPGPSSPDASAGARWRLVPQVGPAGGSISVTARF